MYGHVACMYVCVPLYPVPVEAREDLTDAPKLELPTHVSWELSQGLSAGATGDLNHNHQTPRGILSSV